jgi:hypothetical protein
MHWVWAFLRIFKMTLKLLFYTTFYDSVITKKIIHRLCRIRIRNADLDPATQCTLSGSATLLGTLNTLGSALIASFFSQAVL